MLQLAIFNHSILCLTMGVLSSCYYSYWHNSKSKVKSLVKDTRSSYARLWNAAYKMHYHGYMGKDALSILFSGELSQRYAI